MVGDGGAQAFDALRPFSANSVWTVRDGKVARARFFADREAGLRAAGLRDRTGD